MDPSHTSAARHCAGPLPAARSSGSGCDGGGLDRLPIEILVILWPDERVLSGMAVCKKFRQCLPMRSSVLQLNGVLSIARGNVDAGRSVPRVDDVFRMLLRFQSTPLEICLVRPWQVHFVDCSPDLFPGAFPRPGCVPGCDSVSTLDMERARANNIIAGVEGALCFGAGFQNVRALEYGLFRPSPPVLQAVVENNRHCLRRLLLGGCTLDASACAMLPGAVRGCVALESFSVAESGVDFPALLGCVEAFASCGKLRDINLSGNSLGSGFEEA